MKMRLCPVNFEDARGAIRDIFVGVPKEHITIISTAKGSVRGNHYHKVSQQSDYLVSGKMRVLGQKIGEPIVTDIVWNPGEVIDWDANEVHEFIALEDSIFLTFVNGVRGGDNFEKDTFRVEKPLHESTTQSSL
jgi:quercetin dioxygenase-like cupin family protein